MHRHSPYSDRSMRRNSFVRTKARAIARRLDKQGFSLNQFLVALVLISMVVLAFRPAAAAPQILGLVASADPLPMKCENGLCATEASVFCLQKWRSSPTAGMTYNPAGGEGLHIIALTEDGKEVIVPEPVLKITALRGHSAVQIGVDVDWLYERNYKSVALKIGQKVSLIPEAWAGDTNPLSKKDVEMALGPLRELGHKLVDTAGQNVATAQLLSHIGGKLPRLGRAHDQARNIAWKSGLDDISNVDPKVLKKAKRKFDRCHDITFGGMTSLRQCLGAQHDILMGKLNARYWSANEYGM
jgi:hypothetical protein